MSGPSVPGQPEDAVSQAEQILQTSFDDLKSQAEAYQERVRTSDDDVRDSLEHLNALEVACEDLLASDVVGDEEGKRKAIERIRELQEG